MTKKTKKNKKGVQGRSRTPTRRNRSPFRRSSSRNSPRRRSRSNSPFRRSRNSRRRRSRGPSPRTPSPRGRLLSRKTENNLKEETVRGYSHAIIEVLNIRYGLGIEYYPETNSNKQLQYFQDTLNNLRKNIGNTDYKIKKINNNISDSDMNYLLIDGENIFYGINDAAAIRQELERFRSLTNAGCIFLFCQTHSIESGGKFSFLHETPGRFLIIDGASKTELDDIYLVMAERLIRSRKGYASCSIGTGYPRTSCRHIVGNRINIYTNDNFGWS